MTGDASLRSYVFLDRMQPQFTAFVASNVRGYLPVTGQAALYVEVEPAMALIPLLDRALKGTRVRPSLQIVERAYGLLEVHDEDPAQVREAGRQVLAHLGARESDRLKPRVLSSEVITQVDEHQIMLVNRMRKGAMLLSGETLFVLEVHPAGYAVLAANEAEKRAAVRLLHLRPYGAFGRVWLGGSEAEIRQAQQAVVRAIEEVHGRAQTAVERSR